jgi:hypothetical protein
MRFLRAVKLVGWALLAVAVPFALLDSAARSSALTLFIGVAGGAVLGIGAGLIFRHALPLERRLQFFRSLSPGLARRLMPTPKDTNGKP